MIGANGTDEPIMPEWYIDWYNKPDNAIRRWDEQHGHVLVVENGRPYHVVASRAVTDGTESTYPGIYVNRRLDNFSVTQYDPQNRPMAAEALKTARMWVENFEQIRDKRHGKGLYFTSETRGSGKTLLATAIGAELVRRKIRVRFCGMPGLLDEIKAGYDRESGQSSAQVIQSAMSIPVLILDDVGVEKQSNWVNETVYKILDYRMTHGLSTLFTSNLTVEELAYDERIKSRIGHMALTVQLPEESVRRKITAQDNERFRRELLGE